MGVKAPQRGAGAHQVLVVLAEIFVRKIIVRKIIVRKLVDLVVVVVGQVRVGAPAARELSRKVLGGAEQRVAVVPRDATCRHEKVDVPRKPGGVSRLRPPPSAALTGEEGGGGAGAAPRGGCRAAASDPRGRCCP